MEISSGHQQFTHTIVQPQHASMETKDANSRFGRCLVRTTHCWETSRYAELVLWLKMSYGARDRLIGEGHVCHG